MSTVIWNLLDFRKQMKYVLCLKVIPCNHAHSWQLNVFEYLRQSLHLGHILSPNEFLFHQHKTKKQTRRWGGRERRKRETQFSKLVWTLELHIKDFGPVEIGPSASRAGVRTPIFILELPTAQLPRWGSWTGFANCDCSRMKTKAAIGLIQLYGVDLKNRWIHIRILSLIL